MPFHGDVVVREVDATRFVVVEPLSYTGRREDFTVLPGFSTDFASVPRALVWLFPRYGAYSRAAILHDYLWRTNVVPRRDADGLFRRAMRELGVPFPRRWAMWGAVRLGSHMAGASPVEWGQFLLVLVTMVPFVAVPAVVVQVWLVLWWLVEALFWLAGRLFRRPSEYPTHPFRT